MSRRCIAKLNSQTGQVDLNWNPSAANGDVWAIAVNGSNFFVGGEFTRMNGVSQMGFAHFTTKSLSVEHGSLNIPSGYNLLQNNPNPFNPSTAIKFELPVSSVVSVKIYDMLGREVIDLINEEKSSGSHTINWNGRDNSGQMVSSGVYLYRLRAGTFTETKKMNLIK